MCIAASARFAALLVITTAGCRSGDGATYTFSGLDFPEATSVVASGINDAGDIVGWYAQGDTVRGFVYRRGKRTTVEYPGAVRTHLFGIGPAGDIVGGYANAGEAPKDLHGFLLTASGEFRRVDSPGHKNTIAQRILPDGTILGCQHGDNYGESMRGISVRGDTIAVLDVPATMTNGGTPDGSRLVGLVMDTHRGFLIDRGVFTQFDAPGAVGTQAWDINPSGTIVGVSVSPDSTNHGFAMRDGHFSAIDFPRAASTVAFGINARGDVVGAFVDSAGQRHGYVARRN
jgi:uncharacterized membrane protein